MCAVSAQGLTMLRLIVERHKRSKCHVGPTFTIPTHAKQQPSVTERSEFAGRPTCITVLRLPD